MPPAPGVAGVTRVAQPPLLKGARVVFGSGSGTTAAAAGLVAERLSTAAEPASGAELLPRAELLVVGVPTWATGTTSLRSGTPVDDALWLLREAASDGSAPLAGTCAAVFGAGDARQWSDNFCDALDEAHRALVAAGATPVGAWEPTDAYLNTSSKAWREDRGAFVGLPLDHVSQPELSVPRIRAWCDQVAREAGLACGGGGAAGADGDVLVVSRPEPHAPATTAWVAAPGAGEHALFGRQLTGGWYDLGGDEASGAAAGRWVKFGDDALYVRAGLRGQPERRLPYSSVASAEAVRERGQDANQHALVLHVVGGDSGMLVLRGIPEHEVGGVAAFLRWRGACPP